MNLKKLFGDCRIVGIAGNRNSGKTNNLVYLLREFRATNKETPIYAYGFPHSIKDCLDKLKIRVIDSLKQLVNKRDCILVIEEMQKLKLNDRRYKEIKDEFIDFIYHNNVYCILSSPNIREFNSVIGGNIERWLLKSLDVDQCINGSQLKKAIDLYKGTYKKLGCIDMPKDKLLLINPDEEIVIDCSYVEWADTKRGTKDLFANKIVKKKSEANCQRIVKQNI